MYVMLEQEAQFVAERCFLFCLLYAASFTKLHSLTWEVLALFVLATLLGFHQISLHMTVRACQQICFNDFFFHLLFSLLVLAMLNVYLVPGSIVADTTP